MSWRSTSCFSRAALSTSPWLRDAAHLLEQEGQAAVLVNFCSVGKPLEWESEVKLGKTGGSNPPTARRQIT